MRQLVYSALCALWGAQWGATITHLAWQQRYWDGVSVKGMLAELFSNVLVLTVVLSPVVVGVLALAIGNMCDRISASRCAS